jgi:hypothetical protein
MEFDSFAAVNHDPAGDGRAYLKRWAKLDADSDRVTGALTYAYSTVAT